MAISKKTYFILGFSSLLVPFFLGLTPVNRLPHWLLKLENDPLVEEPTFDWGLLKDDSVTVRNPENNKLDTVKNNLRLRDKAVGNYFETVSNYHKQNFGLRPLYVRLRNQIDYSIFNKPNAKSVIIGKEGYLYEKQYIDAYYGRDYIGEDSIKKKVEKLKFIQDQLKKQNKLLLVVVAPGKGSFYPEYIPENLKSEKRVTNYQTYLKHFNEKGINHIDFNADYIRKKNKTQHVLYPKTGIHWSQHAMYYSLDSMVKYIEKKQQIDLPEIEIRGGAKTAEVKFKDNDIEKGLNLFFGLDKPQMSYPEFRIIPDETKVRPKVLSIADSFYWQFYDLEVSDKLFTNGKFWFYNSLVYPDSKYGRGYVFAEYKNLFEEIQKNDVVILLASEANMYKFSFGFIEKSYATLKSGLENYERRIKELKSSILESPEWTASVQRKADKRGITLEEMLILDAQYMYELELIEKDKIK